MKAILVLLVFICNVTFAQLSVPFEIQSDDSIPCCYKYDVAKFSEHLYDRIPAIEKNGIHDQMSHVFSCQAAYEVANFLYSGNIYYQQNELTNYINEVLQKVMPVELQNDIAIKAFLVADGRFNAFMTPTGQMFVNIGLITELPDEATLAAIMAHELAHYYLNHSLYGYFASETGMLDFGLLGVNDKVIKKYSSKHELSADSLAIRWLKDSDYNIDGIMRCFEVADMIEKNYLSKCEDVVKTKVEDHPTSEIRLGKLRNYYNKYKADTGAYFLVSEKKFKKFQKDIKSEVLKCLLNDAMYTSCIERAFKYHLYEPYSAVYLRYLLEAMRRECYLDATLWNQNFITGNFYETLVVNNTQSRKKMKDHLFVSPRYNILGITQTEADNIKAKFYWDGDPKFKTNEEAFNYFYKICQSFNDHESVLTNALSFVDDTVYRNKYLKKYLAFSDAKYKEYARCLLHDSLLEALKPDKMIVLANFTAQIRFGKETVSLQSCIYNNNNFLSSLTDSIGKKRGISKCLYLSELKSNNLNDYKLFIELQRFSFFPISSKGNKAEIQILNPEYWQFFKKYGINQVEFLNCIFLEDRKWDKNMSAFTEGQNFDFVKIATEKFHTSSIQNVISQVRIQKDKTSQYAFYNGSRPLNFNESVENQLVFEILTQLSLKDKGLIKHDNWIKENKTTY